MKIYRKFNEIGGGRMVEMSKAEEVMQSYKQLGPIERATVEGVLLGILTAKQQLVNVPYQKGGEEDDKSRGGGKDKRNKYNSEKVI